jgi:hypothetical protein
MNNKLLLTEIFNTWEVCTCKLQQTVLVIRGHGMTVKTEKPCWQSKNQPGELVQQQWILSSICCVRWNIPGPSFQSKCWNLSIISDSWHPYKLLAFSICVWMIAASQIQQVSICKPWTMWHSAKWSNKKNSSTHTIIHECLQSDI